MSINLHSLNYVPWGHVWRRNRDVTSGIDNVKRLKHFYLPSASSRQTADEYDAWIKHVTFFPAARRILSGHIGLMFRKRVVLEATPLVSELCKFVTHDGLDLDDFAEEVARESLITNFTGLLVDYPQTQAGITLADSINMGVRPWIGIYRAETILELKHGIRNNQKVITYVRLMDCEEEIRELMLDDNGNYVVRLHLLVGQEYVQQEDVIPTMNGKPLQKIPFVLVTHNHKPHPTTPVIDDVVNLNLNHYLVSSQLATARMFQSFPQAYVCGYDTDENGALVELDSGPDVTWYFKAPETKVGYLEFTGKGVEYILKEREHLEQQIATAGFGMLADEKSGVEAAEALKIRKASENSVLAQITRAIARSIRDALNIMAEWADGSEVQFSINTSFIPQDMPPQMFKEATAALIAGTISEETYFHMMRDSNVIDETLTFEEEQARKATDKALTPLEAAAQPTGGPVDVQKPV